MHSPMFEKLSTQFQMGYITKATLKRRVVLYETKPEKGITEDEYEEITGEPYED